MTKRLVTGILPKYRRPTDVVQVNLLLRNGVKFVFAFGKLCSVHIQKIISLNTGFMLNVRIKDIRHIPCSIIIALQIKKAVSFHRQFEFALEPHSFAGEFFTQTGKLTRIQPNFVVGSGYGREAFFRIARINVFFYPSIGIGCPISDFD